MIKKLLLNIRLFFHGLFYGLKEADEIISQKASYGSSDIEISQEKHTDGVFADFLKGQETQQVKETRDEYYRVLREADQFHVEVDGDFETDKGDLTAKVRKKTALDYGLKVDIYNPEKLSVRVIQDNKLIPKHGNMFAEDLFNYGMDDFVSIFNFERDGFEPRFKLEKYINKIVVRNIDDTSSYVDMYTTMYASQFGKVDAILISQLNMLKESGNKKSDITSIDKISFVTDKAYGENDLFEFSYDNIVFESINVFDGNFVLTFKCRNVKNGFDITEKYKTKELDEKLEKHSVRDTIKNNGIDIFTANRHIKDEEKISFETQRLTLTKDENSD